MKRHPKWFFWMLTTLLLCAAQVAGSVLDVWAVEKVNVAIISFSPYGAWYIVKEKQLGKGI